MSFNEVSIAPGAPDDRSAGGRMLHYSGQLLHLDSKNQFIGITDRKLQ